MVLSDEVSAIEARTLWRPEQHKHGLPVAVLIVELVFYGFKYKTTQTNFYFEKILQCISGFFFHQYAAVQEHATIDQRLERPVGFGLLLSTAMF